MFTKISTTTSGFCKRSGMTESHSFWLFDWSVNRHCISSNLASRQISGPGTTDLVTCPSLYTFFSHDCTPTIKKAAADAESSTREVWYASRDINAGEEIFINLVDVNLPKAARQNELRCWLAGECNCTRCQSEVDDITTGAAVWSFHPCHFLSTGQER